MKLDLPAPLSPRMHVTSPALTYVEMSLSATMLPKNFQIPSASSRWRRWLRHAHLDPLTRAAAMTVLSITAANRIAPWNVNVQLLSHSAKMIPSDTMPSMAAPKNAPIDGAGAAGQQAAADDGADDEDELEPDALLGLHRTQLERRDDPDQRGRHRRHHEQRDLRARHGNADVARSDGSPPTL